jgi:hypothetical protein
VGGGSESKVQNTYDCITHLELVNKVLEKERCTQKAQETMR